MSFKTQLGYMYLINEGLTICQNRSKHLVDVMLCIYEHESVYINRVGGT